MVALGATATCGVILCRGPLLRSIGSLLVAEEPLAPADVIVLTIDARAAGVLEVSELVHAGMATRVAVFLEQPDEADRELIRRGFNYEDQSAVWRRMLTFLGVTDVQTIPAAPDGTNDESRLLRDWCNQRRYQSVIAVTNSDHSRRVRRVFGRAMKDVGIKVMVKPARLSPFDPDTWWQSRKGLRAGIVEFQKLALDMLRHPIP